MKQGFPEFLQQESEKGDACLIIEHKDIVSDY